jgi:argininosuccinate lyase
MNLTFDTLVVNRDRLLAAFTPEIFAADLALDLVAGGMPFREAYGEVGRNLDALKTRDPVGAIESRSSTGTAGNLRLDVARAESSRLAEAIGLDENASRKKITALAGRDVELFRDPFYR